MPNGFSVSYYDENGDDSTGKMWVDDAIVDPDDIDFLTSLNGVTNAGVNRLTVHIDNPVTTVTTGTGALDIEDKAVFQFLDEDGYYYEIQVPAPPTTIFGSDGKTILPTGSSTPVADFVADCILYFVTRAGVALVEYVKGWRERRQRARS